MTVQSKIASEVRWTSLITILTAATHVAITAILGHILLPADYGAYASANSLLVIVSHLGQRGVINDLLQRRSLDSGDLGNAVVATVVLAAIFSALILVASLAAEQVSSRADVSLEMKLVRVTILSMVILLATAPAVALLQRQLNIKVTSLISFVSLLAGSGAMTILLARMHYGAWSLAYGAIASSLVTMVLAVAFARPSVRFTWAPKQWFRFLSGGAKMSGLRTLDMLWLQFGIFFSTYFLYAAETGILQRMHYLSLLGFQLTVWNLFSVLYPLIAQRKDRTQEAGSNFVDSYEVTATLTMFVLALMFSVRKETVMILFGAGWEGGVTVYAILLMVFSVFCLNQISVIFQEGYGHLRQRYFVAATTLMLFVVGCIIVRPTSSQEIALIMGGSAIWQLLSSTYISANLFNFSPSLILFKVVRPFLLSVVSLISADFFARALPVDMPLWLVAATKLCLCAVVISLAMRFAVEERVSQRIHLAVGKKLSRLLAFSRLIPIVEQKE